MDKIYPDSPAFPYSDSYKVGLTKREYLAAITMNGILAQNGLLHGDKKTAEKAVQYADALIEALNKQPEDSK